MTIFYPPRDLLQATKFVAIAFMAINAHAQQQPAPPPRPTPEANANAAIKASPRTTPPPPPVRSNGSTGWVISTKPAHISLADIPAMFPSR